MHLEGIEAAYAAGPFIREVALLEQDGGLAALVVPDLEAMRQSGTGALNDLLRVTLATLSMGMPPEERIASYVLTRDALPRTPRGALERHLLPELYARALAGDHPSRPEGPSEDDRALLASPRARKAWNWLLARYPERALTLDTCPQLELGIDSLDWVSLSLEIGEETGIALSEEAIARVITLRDLLREIAPADSTQAKALPRDNFAHPESVLSPERARWLKAPGPALVALGIPLYALNWLLVRTLFRLRIEGADRLPRRGPFVVACNHVSDLDHFIVAAALSWPRMRRTRWGGEITRLFAGPFRRLLCRTAGVVPVDDRAAASTLALACAVLAQGESLVWFPESWRSPDGELQPFLRGIGMLLEHSGAPAVPAYIWGTYEAMPRWRTWPRPKPVGILFGQPLDPSELEGSGRGRDSFARIADGLRNAIAALGETREGAKRPSAPAP